VNAAKTAQSLAMETDLPVPFGIGIHYGEVLYGNVGARSRIDFTVLGQSVNTAARIEALTAQSAHPVLVSDVVADLAITPMTHVRTERLKGLSAPMSVFAPAKS
jgi:adenylate cyclase